MQKTEKTRPAASPAERETESTGINTPFPMTNDSTDKKETQEPFIIAALLPRGAQNAVKTKELLRITGIKTARELQLLIAEERRAGALILSKSDSSGGYFLPSEGEQGKAEIRAFERTLHARAANTFAALKAAKAALKDGDTNGR